MDDTELSAVELDDPVFRTGLREALVILAVFTVALLWSVTWSLADGYYAPGEIPADIPLVWGMPRWVFWGVLVPWIAADVFTIWFCFFFMVDDDLGAGGDADPVATPDTPDANRSRGT
jgi:hypothetical protein